MGVVRVREIHPGNLVLGRNGGRAHRAQGGDGRHDEDDLALLRDVEYHGRDNHSNTALSSHKPSLLIRQRSVRETAP